MIDINKPCYIVSNIQKDNLTTDLYTIIRGKVIGHVFQDKKLVSYIIDVAGTPQEAVEVFANYKEASERHEKMIIANKK